MIQSKINTTREVCHNIHKKKLKLFRSQTSIKTNANVFSMCCSENIKFVLVMKNKLNLVAIRSIKFDFEFATFSNLILKPASRSALLLRYSRKYYSQRQARRHRGKMPINNSGNGEMLSAIEEMSDIYDAFAPHVDTTKLSGIADIVPLASASPAKKLQFKTFLEVQQTLQQGKKREVKLMIRENNWPIHSSIRSQLWPVLCAQHQIGKSMLDGFYWDMVNQVFGTTELPEKPIMLPPFVDSTHCLPYFLNKKGRAVADRIVSVLGYACPDITYSPSLYPITAILLHYMSEEECYHCLASLIAAKEKVFITQTKLLFEVTWKTVMQISKKHAKPAIMYLTRLCTGQKVERLFTDWMWWILSSLPFTHLVRVMDCFLHEGIKVFYRVALAILILFNKHSSSANSSVEWSTDSAKNDIDNAIPKFCKNIPVTPSKLLRTAFSIRNLRVFIKTEMVLKSKSVLTGPKQLVRSRSSDNLPTSQSQLNIQMMSHTLTIREVS
uniref:CSON004065 protein n=1 Tax=Culicoides sonorensis TaxID=179676 RepID=A0A336LWN7_CULSO